MSTNWRRIRNLAKVRKGDKLRDWDTERWTLAPERMWGKRTYYSCLICSEGSWDVRRPRKKISARG